MSIEWVPRGGYDGNGWHSPRRSTGAGAPRLVDVALGQGMERGVLVPIATHRADTGMTMKDTVRSLIGTGVVVCAATTHLYAGAGVGVALLGSAGPRLVRRVRLAGREPSLILSPGGLHVADLLLPWSTVTEVVRFHRRGPRANGMPGRHHWNMLAVRVADFDSVVGLPPARAGLANLTKRRLVVIAEASELSEPLAVARAMELLIANPAARLLLSGPEGPRLLGHGPPGQ